MVVMQCWFFGIDYYVIEEGVYLWVQVGQVCQYCYVIFLVQVGVGVVDGRGDCFGQCVFGIFLQQCCVDLCWNFVFGFVQDVVDVFVGRGQCFCFWQCGEGVDCIQVVVKVIQ